MRPTSRTYSRAGPSLLGSVAVAATAFAASEEILSADEIVFSGQIFLITFRAFDGHNASQTRLLPPLGSRVIATN